MLDTIELGCRVAVNPERFGDDWQQLTRRKGPDVTVKYVRQTDDGVNLCWRSVGWLSASVSLPAFLVGRNDVVLSWSQVETALDGLLETMAGEVGIAFPSWREMTVTRADCCWGWPYPASAYLSAMVFSRLPKTHLVRWPNSLIWQTFRNRTRCRLYSKRAEFGDPAVVLDTRLERQVRPNRERLRLDGQLFPNRAGDLSERLILDTLRATLRELGLDRPVETRQAARVRLERAYGRRQGAVLWRAAADFYETGVWPDYASRPTIYRWQGMLKAAGVNAATLDGTELPALTLPV
jgi:hypothetical protein